MSLSEALSAIFSFFLFCHCRTVPLGEGIIRPSSNGTFDLSLCRNGDGSIMDQVVRLGKKKKKKKKTRFTFTPLVSSNVEWTLKFPSVTHISSPLSLSNASRELQHSRKYPPMLHFCSEARMREDFSADTSDGRQVQGGAISPSSVGGNDRVRSAVPWLRLPVPALHNSNSTNSCDFFPY